MTCTDWSVGEKPRQVQTRVCEGEDSSRTLSTPAPNPATRPAPLRCAWLRSVLFSPSYQICRRTVAGTNACNYFLFFFLVVAFSSIFLPIYQRPLDEIGPPTNSNNQRSNLINPKLYVSRFSMFSVLGTFHFFYRSNRTQATTTSGGYKTTWMHPLPFRSRTRRLPLVTTASRRNRTTTTRPTLPLRRVMFPHQLQLPRLRRL